MRQKTKRHQTKDNFRQFVIDEAWWLARQEKKHEPSQMYELAHGVIVVRASSGYFFVYVNENQWSLGKFRYAKSTSHGTKKRIDAPDLLHSYWNSDARRITTALKNHLTARHLCTWHEKPQYFDF